MRAFIVSSPVNDDSSKDEYLEGKVRVFCDHLKSLLAQWITTAVIDWQVWYPRQGPTRYARVLISAKINGVDYSILKMTSPLTYPY